MAHIPEFGDAVKKALGTRSYRQVAPRAGISPSHIGNMAQGYVPTRDKVLKLAEALDTDPDPLLLAAGYTPLASGGGPSASEDPDTVPLPRGVAEDIYEYLERQSEELGGDVTLRCHGGEASLAEVDSEELIRLLQAGIEALKRLDSKQP